MAHFLKIPILFFWCLSILMCSPLDLGVYGTLFEIEEEDMIELFQKKLKKIEGEGGLLKLEEKLKEKIKVSINRPTPVEGLTKTTHKRTFEIDPTLLIENDIQTEKGEYLAKKGDKINPLHHVKGVKPLLFIDGDDETQVLFAKKQKEGVDIVLVKGSPFDLMKDFDQKIYFDQGGYLTTYYKIKSVPAKIVYGNDVITVEEVVSDD
jgi:conjugal transfer pilus assembly protein TraW